MVRQVDLLSASRPSEARTSRVLPQPAPVRGGFASVLEEARRADPVRFSRHASERMDARSISLSPAQETRLAEAVDEAAAKGGRESLVLMGPLALVVSVANRTVITAVPASELGHQVFTNIDSAVVVPPGETTPPAR